MKYVKGHITPTLYAHLEGFAREDGLSISAYLRRLLIERMKAAGWTPPAEPRGVHGEVYLIRCFDRFKIGKAADAKSRISGMCLPAEPEIIAIYRCADYGDLEKELHSTFAAKRVYGEWFVLNDEEVAKIRERLRAS